MEHSHLSTDQTTDYLYDGNLKFLQPAKGYRFSIDAVLLSGAAPFEDNASIADLGSGCGIISLSLAFFGNPHSIRGIELQPHLAALAKENIQLNDLSKRVEVMQGDIREVSRLLPENAFDLVVSNPPFYPLNTGRLSPNPGRAVARHELNGTFLDFARGAHFLLKDTGRFVIIHRADMTESLLKDLARSGLHASWIQYVHSNSQSPPWRVLIETRPGKERQVIVRPRLNLRQNGVYTPSIQALVDGNPELAFKTWKNRCSR